MNGVPIGQHGRIRMSPLVEAAATPAANSVIASPLATQAAINSANGPTNYLDPSTVNPNALTPEQQAVLQEQAEAGDVASSDVLKTLGIIAGVATAGAAGYALYKARKGKGSPGITSPNFGAKSVQSTGAKGSSSKAVALPDAELLDWKEVPNVHPLPRPEANPRVGAALRAARRVGR